MKSQTALDAAIGRCRENCDIMELAVYLRSKGVASDRGITGKCWPLVRLLAPRECQRATRLIRIIADASLRILMDEWEPDFLPDIRHSGDPLRAFAGILWKDSGGGLVSIGLDEGADHWHYLKGLREAMSNKLFGSWCATFMRTLRLPAGGLFNHVMLLGFRHTIEGFVADQSALHARDVDGMLERFRIAFSRISVRRRNRLTTTGWQAPCSGTRSDCEAQLENSIKRIFEDALMRGKKGSKSVSIYRYIVVTDRLWRRDTELLDFGSWGSQPKTKGHTTNEILPTLHPSVPLSARTKPVKADNITCFDGILLASSLKIAEDLRKMGAEEAIGAARHEDYTRRHVFRITTRSGAVYYVADTQHCGDISHRTAVLWAEFVDKGFRWTADLRVEELWENVAELRDLALQLGILRVPGA